MKDVLIPRYIGPLGEGLVLKNALDCETTVIKANGETVEATDYDGTMYLCCNIGDRIVIHYKNKNYTRTFKVKALERTNQFFVCEIIYTIEEGIEMELLSIAELVKSGKMTTNAAHLKADQLLVELLYKNKLDKVADAFNKIPKYYE